MAHTCTILVQIISNSVIECCDHVSPGISEVLPNTYLMFSHQISLASGELWLHGFIPSGCSWKCWTHEIVSLDSDMFSQLSEKMVFTFILFITPSAGLRCFALS